MSEVSGSERSSFTGASSVADSEHLSPNILNDKTTDDESADLVDSTSTVRDAVFSCIHLLTGGNQTRSIRGPTLVTLLEYLQLFLVVFNPGFLWNLDETLWIWKGIRWTLFRLVVINKGYGLYIRVFYVIVSLVFLSSGLSFYATLLLKKGSGGNPWTKRLVRGLQLYNFLASRVFFTATVDYLISMLDCDYQHIKDARHELFAVECLAMPHIVHSTIALLSILIFIPWSICLVAASCSKYPFDRNLLATSCPMLALKIQLIKTVLIIVASILDAGPQVQAIIMVICCLLVLYHQIRGSPYHHVLMNHVWAGFWLTLAYMTAIILAMTYMKDRHDLRFQERHTKMVLYGIFPMLLGGGGMSWLWCRHQARLLGKFRFADRQAQAKDVHRFSDADGVELLMKRCRGYDVEGQPLKDRVELAGFILKCGLSEFPHSAMLLIVEANLSAHARQAVAAARSQIQTAAKTNPSMIEQYFIYAFMEELKKANDDAGAELDLIGFVEYQRNFRACIRAHRRALQAQRLFWMSLLRDTVHFTHLQGTFEVMEETQKQAEAVYKRAMERYPSSGKLHKAYGRFLEYVCHDPWAANKYYSVAIKLGLGESLLSMSTSTKEKEGAGAGLFTTVDEKTDGIVIINGTGTILMVSETAYRLLGYTRGELEGKSVTVLMPPPFSANHNGYMQRYAQTGESHVLDCLRDLVAVHKNRSVLPVQLGATRLSGLGNDAIFMGVMKPIDVSRDAVQVWTTTTGTIVCADPRYLDWFGRPHQELAGMEFRSLGESPELLTKLVAQAATASMEVVQAGSIRAVTNLFHTYLGAQEVEIVARMGGSENQRLCIMCVRRTCASLPVMVLDHKLRISYVNSDLAGLLGYPKKTLLTMDLTQLVPQPAGPLHTAWCRELSTRIPVGSCRSGHVVHLLAANSKLIPVTIKVEQQEEGSHLHHVVEVWPSTLERFLDEQRLTVTVDQEGAVSAVSSDTPKDLFGFSPSTLISRSIASFVNIFKEWQQSHSNEGLGTALDILVEKAREMPGASWRVTITPPHSVDGAATTTQDTRSFTGHLHSCQIWGCLGLLQPGWICWECGSFTGRVMGANQIELQRTWRILK